MERKSKPTKTLLAQLSIGHRFDLYKPLDPNIPIEEQELKPAFLYCKVIGCYDESGAHKYVQIALPGKFIEGTGQRAGGRIVEAILSGNTRILDCDPSPRAQLHSSHLSSRSSV